MYSVMAKNCRVFIHCDATVLTKKIYIYITVPDSVGVMVSSSQCVLRLPHEC